jgi:hypothetical protein
VEEKKRSPECHEVATQALVAVVSLHVEEVAESQRSDIISREIEGPEQQAKDSISTALAEWC